jgi:hypothetical protein
VLLGSDDEVLAIAAPSLDESVGLLPSQSLTASNLLVPKHRPLPSSPVDPPSAAERKGDGGFGLGKTSHSTSTHLLAETNTTRATLSPSPSGPSFSTFTA